ncbi:MAG: hypothetical protein NZM44_07480 [Candidatus Calescibacterium sp.]|nr:hypothetical protein [Candidatus Calescibacterium sp.]
MNDTLKIERSFLMSDDLYFHSIDGNNEVENDLCCYSDKYKIKNGYYLIQFVSKAGSTRYIGIGRNSNDFKLYILHRSDDFPDRISVDEFLRKIEGNCSKKQYSELKNRLKILTKMNQKRFPVFAK